MKKIFIYIIIFILTNINISYALDKTWDFSDSTEYTQEDTSLTVIGSSIGQLKIQLNHTGSLTDGTNGAVLDQTQGIEIVGNYAYLTTRSSNALEIVDISDPSNPSHVGKIVDGGAVTLRRAQDLVIDGNYAYITSNRDDALEIVDISDPTNPSHVSSTPKSSTIQLNGAIGIEKVGDYVYIAANSDDGLEILDVSDPANPSHVGALTDGTRLNGAEDIKIVGNYAYITAESNDSFEVIDISDPTNPSFVGELTDGTNGATLNGASGIFINGDFAYVAANAGDAIEIINISDPTNPLHVASIANGGDILLNGPENIRINGNFAYITSQVSDAIEVLDISNPYTPIHVTSITNGGSTLLDGASDLRVIGNYIYIASDTSDALEIIEITYPKTSPYIIANISLVYSGSIDKITTIFSPNNEGNVSYQISKDDGSTWYYLDSNDDRTSTTAGVSESNTEDKINSKLPYFNGLAGTDGNFIWKVFLTSNGNQKIEIDDIKIGYSTDGYNEIIDFETAGGYTVTDGTWARQTSEQYEGSYAIEADNGGDDDSISCFEVNRDIYSDSTISFYRKVDSEASYDFLKFYLDGDKLDEWSGNVARGSGSYNIGNGNHTFKWCYEKDGSVAEGSDTAWVDYIEIKALPIITEVAVLDFEVEGGYTVTTTVTGTDTDWIRQKAVVHQGEYAIESQTVDQDDTNVCFTRDQTIGSNDTGIAFWKKVSSEDSYDYLHFSIDGTEQNKWSGEIDWSKELYPLDPGDYTLEWCYSKDGSVSNGDDKARVDFVVLTQDPPLLTEVTPVPTPTNDTTPDYTFNSTMTGSISYSGSCTSTNNTGAIVGDNTITFDELVDGTYTDCTIQILGEAENSIILPVSNFTIDTTGTDIIINTPLDGDTIANSDFILDVEYTDTGSSVDTGSIVIGMYERDGSAWGSDISDTYIDFTGATIDGSGATYDVTNPGEGKYKIDFSITNGANVTTTATTVFDIANGDLEAPIITNNLPFSGSLIPNSNFNIDISYTDTGGISTGSLDIEIYKWDGSNWGGDISSTYVDFSGATITESGAIFPIDSKLGFGKYQLYTYIEDVNSNSGTTNTDFYIDEPELIINTGSLDIGTIQSGSDIFSTNEYNITVKTVGAGFDLLLNQTGQMLHDTFEIIQYDGTNGIGFDQDPYTSTINKINNDQVIASQSGSINTDGEKNIYLYKLKMGVNINSEQAAGSYTGKLNFGLKLDY